jgi:hypothetical protein
MLPLTQIDSEARGIGDLALSSTWKRLRAIAAATQARWLNMEGYARLCINARIGNALISADA